METRNLSLMCGLVFRVSVEEISSLAVKNPGGTSRSRLQMVAVSKPRSEKWLRAVDYPLLPKSLCFPKSSNLHLSNFKVKRKKSEQVF